MRRIALSLLIALSPATSHAWDADHIPLPILPVGGDQYEGWTGIQVGADSGILKLPGEAMFRYSQGPKGWYVEGFRTENDGTADWRSYYGLQLDLQVPVGRTLELQATMFTPPPALRQEYLAESHAKCIVTGTAGWQRVTLPWTLFDFDQSQSAFLQFIQKLRLSGKFAEGQPDGDVPVKNIRLILAPIIALEADVHGRGVPAGDSARYDVKVANCTDSPAEVSLIFQKNGWEAMTAKVEPTRLTIAPGATAMCAVSVHVPDAGVPPGGHETQKLLAIANGNGISLANIEFITARDVPRPSIIHTPEGWAEVRAKVAKYDWAQKEQETYVKAAEEWHVPEAALPPNNYAAAAQHTYVFDVKDFDILPKVSFAWQLTRNKVFAEKLALFLRRLADEKTGYPSTFAAMNQGGPQEGGSWQNVAIAYDAILDAGVLSDADKLSIEHTMRLYMETFEANLTVGNVGNWSTAQSTAALFCSLSLGDLAATNRYLYGPGGFTDFVTKGVMDDGWWWNVRAPTILGSHPN